MNTTDLDNETPNAPSDNHTAQTGSAPSVSDRWYNRLHSIRVDIENEWQTVEDHLDNEAYPDAEFYLDRMMAICRRLKRHILILALSAACLPSVSAAPTPLCNQNNSIHLQQERGDVKCYNLDVIVASGSQQLPVAQSTIKECSSAASNVQPADAACPQSALAATPLSKPKSVSVSEYPKISPAELYERLIEERRVKWSEPARLPGN